ncbi:MAG: CHRD domain-containing protein [Pirellulaceae bacterium]|nr:CHRD domain-containing protein [Pirellulaceae bacterium]
MTYRNAPQRQPRRKNATFRAGRQRRIGRQELRSESRRRLRVEHLEARQLLATLGGMHDLVGSDLAGIYNEYLTASTGGESNSGGATFVSERANDFLFDGGSVFVEVRTTGEFDSLLGTLQAAGFRSLNQSREHAAVDGFLPITEVGTVAADPAIYVYPVWQDGTNAQGSEANEAEQTLLADFAKQIFGIDGTGVTVGVISDTADSVGGGLADSVATGDLPAGVTVIRPDQSPGIDEGRAMLELVYDIAEGAALQFASGQPFSDLAIGTAIDALRLAGSDIIVDDLISIRNQPWFQDGIASQAVTAAFNAGIPYFSSAGNRGTGGFETPTNFSNDTVFGINGDFQDFDLGGGTDYTHTISLSPGNNTIYFQYDQPLGGVTSDLDIRVYDMGGTLIDDGLDFNTTTQRPWENVSVFNPGPGLMNVQLTVQLFSGAAPTRFKWINIGGSPNGPVEHVGQPGTFVTGHEPGHSGSANAIAVGAANFATPTTPEGFTSVGPTSRSLTPGGAAMPLQIIQNPNLTAHDGVSTSVPGFGSFFGTSAAAPNAAAIAALLLDINPSLTPTQVANILATTATDIGAPGFDFVTGAGVVNGVRAVLAANNGVLELNGTAGNDEIEIQVNGGNNTLLDVIYNGVTLGQIPRADITSIEVYGLGGTDTFRVDFGNGDPVPAGGIDYFGGESAGDNDSLEVIGYNVGTVTVTHTGPESGVVLIGGAAPIDFFETEPLLLGGTAANLIINLPAVSNPDAVLADDLGGVPGVSELRGSTFEDTTFTNPGTSLTVNAFGGADSITMLTLDAGYAATTNINTDGGIDQVMIADTPANTTTNVDTGAGVPGDLLVVGALPGSGGTIATTFAQFNTGQGTLDFLGANSIINYDDGGGVGELYVDDSADATADNVTITSSSITGASPATINYVGPNVNIVQFAAGTASDTLNITSTGADDFSGGRTTVFGNVGNDVFAIAADMLSGRNTFNGDGGNDTFNVNLPAGTTVGQNDVGYSPFADLIINGDSPASDNANRDRVNINLVAGDATVRNVGIDYSTTGGTAGITGLGAGTFTVNTTETVVYTGGTDNNDILTVTGSTNGGEVLSVTPISATEANVFLNGNPMLTVPPGTSNNNNPGVAGGAAGPDLSLRGLAQATGLTIAGGGGAGDRIVVNAPTETGTGVGFAGNPAAGLNSTVRAANAAFDNITINQNSVAITNFSAGGAGTALVQTNIGAGFGTIAGQATVTVNTGDEAGVRPAAFGAGNGAGLVADDVTATLSTLFRFQINAGLPLPPGAAPLTGDRLNLVTPGDVNIYSDAADPPNVSISSDVGGTPTQPVTSNNVELLLVTSGSGVVNILGDNNNTATQNDAIVVLGQDVDQALPGGDLFGDNEFQLLIGGDNTQSLLNRAPVSVRNVLQLNISSFNGDDDIVIDPFANTTTRWEVVTNVDSGAGDDDVTYGNVIRNVYVDNEPDGSQAAMSENVTVTPTLIPGAGEIAVPGVATIHFQNTEDLSFLLNNATAGDTDTLTIRGTDSNLSDIFTIRPDAAGNDAEPLVDLDIGAALTQILQIENVALVAPGGAQFFITAMNFEGLGGSDTFNLLPSANGTVLNIDGGNPTFNPLSGDVIVVPAPADPTNQVSWQAGATNDSGTIVSTLAGTARAAVNFSHVEGITVDNGGAITIVGTNGDNDITVNGTAADAFTAAIDGGPTVQFNAVTSLQINGLGGDDDIDLTVGPLAITSIDIDGGDPTASDTVLVNGTPGQDNVSYTPTGADSGSVTGLGSPINLTATEHLIYNGLGGGDALTIFGDGLDAVFGSGDTFVHTPGLFRDAGRIDLNAAPIVGPIVQMLGLSYEQLGAVPFAGAPVVNFVGDPVGFFPTPDQLIVRGTDNSDDFDVSPLAANASGVNLTTAVGQHVPLATVDFEFLTLVGLDGDDVFNVNAGHEFQTIDIEGGDPSASDELFLFGAPNTAEAVGFRPSTVVPSITRITGLGGTISTTDVERIRYDAPDNNDSVTIDPGFGNQTVRVDSATDFSDRIVSSSLPEIGITQAPSVVHIAPNPASAASTEVTFATNDLWRISDNTTYQTSLRAQDTLVIEGNAAANQYTVINPAVGAVQITDVSPGVGVVVLETGALGGPASLVINTLGGDDIVAVVNNAAGGPVTIPVTYHGEDGNDLLQVISNAASTGTTYSPGPAADSGHIAQSGGVNVFFTGLEPVQILGAGAADSLTVNGTPADNAINYTQGPGGGILAGNTGLVTVDNFESVEFNNFGTLNINGLAGSDTINLNNPVTPVALNAINVDGGDPTASDTVVVNVATAAVISDLTADGATITRTGESTVFVTNAESLMIVGDGSANLTIQGTGGSDTIVHTPGSAIDAGAVRVDNLLPISYQNLGAGSTLTVDGLVGNDTLVANGTSSSDQFDVEDTTGTVTLTSSLGSHLALQQGNVETLTLDGLDGDDNFTINADQPYNVISVLGGGPGASDVLQVNDVFGAADTFIVNPGFDNGQGTVTVNALPVAYLGVEHVLLQASSDAGDALTVNDDLADNAWTVLAGPIFGDRVQIDQRESVDFTGFDTVDLENDFGTDVFNIYPTNLTGFTGSFTVTGATPDDVLNLFGTPAGDAITSAAADVTVNGVTITAGTGLALTAIHGLEGDDNINLSAFTQTALHILGGDGDDTVIGSNQVNVGDLIDGGAGDDALNGGAGDDTLHGGDGNDVIIGGAGNDVGYGGAGNDRFGDPAIADPTANDGGNDQFFGGDGSDTLVWDPGDGSDLFEGGEGADVMIFNGSGGAEVFTFNAVGTRLEFLRSLGAIDMDLADVEQINLNANAGVDSVVVNDLFDTDVQFVSLNLGTDASTDSVTINGRPTDDSLMLTSPAAGQLLLTGLTYTVSLATTEPADLLTLNGNTGDDQITAAPGAEAIMTTTLNGGLGDDQLTGNVLNINGNEGNDTLVGGPGNQTFDGGPGDDTFVGNGGTDNVGGGLGSSVGDTILLSGTTGADIFNLSLSATGQLIATVNGLTTTYANLIGGPIATSGVEQILVQGLAGDDTLTVDSTNGAIPIPINYEGGNNADFLTLTGGVATSNTYQVGPGVGEGTSTIVIGGVTQVVRFSNLEPVLDLVGGPLAVYGTNADNAINYTQGGVAANGLVSVDGFETIEFSNKTTLSINALAGSDTINLHNPATPTGLTAITVNGGDPTASDTVIVNGTAGQDTVTIDQLTVAGARVTGLGPVINIAAAEHLTYNGQGGNDNLIYTLPAGGHTSRFTPGDTSDSAGIVSYQNGGTGALIPFDYTNVGAFLNSVTFTNVSGTRTNNLIVDGTQTADRFTLVGGTVRMTDNLSTPRIVALMTPGVAFLELNGLEGDDDFNLSAPLPFTQVFIEGGGPSASDSVSVTGDGGSAVNATIGNLDGSASLTGGGLGSVSIREVEVLNVSSLNQNLNVSTTTAPDVLHVTPTGTNAARFQANGVSPVLSALGIATLNVNLGGGSDQLVVHGTEAGETIAVTGALVTVGTFETVNYAAAESVTVNGGSGSDTFNVTPSAVPYLINGGNPIGILQQPVGDVLNLIAGAAFTYLPGPEPDSGTWQVAGQAPVSFDEIELLQVNGVNYILPDQFDQPDVIFPGNNSIATATVLGSLPQVTIRDLTLHRTGVGAFDIDEDFFKITAHSTGKLIINAYFVDADGDVDIQLQDAAGNIIAISQSVSDDEQIIVPVVSQQMYFLRVYSADGIANIYDLEIENFAAPVPSTVVLDPNDDSGMMNNDLVTYYDDARVYVIADLQDFADMGIDILTPTEIANGEPGAAVEVFANGSSVGFATQVGALNTLFSFNFDPTGVANGSWSQLIPINGGTAVAPANQGYFNIVTAAVRIFDGQANQATGRTTMSASEDVHFDPNAPDVALATIDLLNASDSGHTVGDNITNISQPAFAGVAEENTKIRLFANGELVGQSVVNSDRSNGSVAPFNNDGLGIWEITVEPLVDGDYDITIELEDVAGNVSPRSPVLLTITVDTLDPQRPTIDLVGVDVVDNDKLGVAPIPSDTGLDTMDNNTRGFARDPVAGTAQVQVRVSAEPGGIVVIKDGENPIDTFEMPSMITTTFALSGAQEVPPNGSPATGTATITLDTHTGDFTWDVSYTPLQGVFTVAHFHGPAPQGLNAPVEVPITATVNPVTRTAVGAAVLSAEQITDLLAGQWYLNIHTNLFPGGEIRGQVLYSPANDFVFRTLTLDEDPHPLSVEVFDWAGNRSAQSEELLVTIDITPPPAPTTPDLLASSDTGMVSTDNVTSINTPAFLGTGEANGKVTIFARNTATNITQIVGQGLIGSDESDLVLDNEIGVWEVTIEPLADGVYEITADVEDKYGNIGVASTALTIEIDTQAPNTPYLDLIAASDTGRHDEDNVTNDNTLTFTMATLDRTARPTEFSHIFATNFKFRIFVRPEAAATGVTGQELLIYDSAVDATIPPANIANGLTSLDFLERVMQQLPDGYHNFKLEVEDRAGNISEDYLLDIVIDTQAFLGDANLHPDSDSGVWGFPATLADRITEDSVPSFFGVAEANNVVTVAIDGIPSGTAVAVPLDGNDAFQPQDPPYQGVEGNWRIDTIRNLADGLHSAVFTFEDLAGNRVSTAPLQFFIDTEGPRIENVTFGEISVDGAVSFDGVTSLFEPKPSGGPDPLVHSIVVHYSDGPNRVNPFLYDPVFQALALEEGNYSVVGDANGNIPIVDVNLISVFTGPGRATAAYELVFGVPLPDDRFTVTVSDSIKDVAGNALDGESNAAAPFDGNDVPNNTPPVFPTGDGEHGGEFVARFTIDSRAELGVWGAGSVWVDTNGNSIFDPENADYVNRDIIYTMGITSDDVFAGNFSGPGPDGIFGTQDDRNPAFIAGDAIADGFDKLAAWGDVGVAGQATFNFRWLIDLDNDGRPDLVSDDPNLVDGYPVAGNFDGVALNGDEVGLFSGGGLTGGGTWYFDTNHDYLLDTSVTIPGMIGLPIVGDFNNDGVDDLGVWSNDFFSISLGNTPGGVGPNSWSTSLTRFRFGFIGQRERPLSADFDADGYDDIGLWVPDRAGAVPEESAEWYILVSGGQSVLNRIEIDPLSGERKIEFVPDPFGDDIYAKFGDDFAKPVVGNFDPPTNPGGTEEQYIHQNPDNRFDVNDDGLVSPADVLSGVNKINTAGSRPLNFPNTLAPFFDVSGDGMHSPADPLAVINYLNARAGSGEGEAAFGSQVVMAQDNDHALVLRATTIEPASDSPAAQPAADAPAGELPLDLSRLERRSVLVTATSLRAASADATATQLPVRSGLVANLAPPAAAELLDMANLVKDDSHLDAILNDLALDVSSAPRSAAIDDEIFGRLGE